MFTLTAAVVLMLVSTADARNQYEPPPLSLSLSLSLYSPAVLTRVSMLDPCTILFSIVFTFASFFK